MRRGFHNLDIPHARFQLPGGRALVPEEAEFDIVGGDGVAIVEGDPSTQEKFIGEAVGTLGPGFRQAGGQRLARHGFHQGIVEGIQKQERRDNARGLSGVEPGGGQGDVHPYSQLPARLGRRVRHPPGPEREPRGAAQRPVQEPASRARASLIKGLLRHGMSPPPR